MEHASRQVIALKKKVHIHFQTGKYFLCFCNKNCVDLQLRYQINYFHQNYATEITAIITELSTRILPFCKIAEDTKLTVPLEIKMSCIIVFKWTNIHSWSFELVVHWHTRTHTDRQGKGKKSHAIAYCDAFNSIESFHRLANWLT